jgi:hypothetical protein
VENRCEQFLVLIICVVPPTLDENREGLHNR